jgi:predicted nucleotidyltransferase
MRIDKNQIKIIKQSAEAYFGEHAMVYLFGSRVQDNLKGGDIDLLVSTDEDKMTFKNKVLFLVDLKKHLGDQKIDVVFDKENKSNQYFLKSIKQKNIPLC